MEVPLKLRHDAVRMRHLLTALLLTLLAGFSSAHAQAPESRHVSIAVGGKSGLHYLALTIAEQLGYFADEGLQVEISDFAGGAKALEAMLGGSADVVSGGYEQIIAMQAKGLPLRAFVLMGLSPQIAIGVASRKPAGVGDARDLKGMRVGVSAPGSTTHVALLRYLAAAGLGADDVSVVGVGTGAGALAALRSGQIDAISNVDPVMTMLEERYEVRILADSRTLRGARRLFGGTMPSACLYATEDFVRRRPRTVQALATAMLRADRWLQHATPADIIGTVPESYQLGDPVLYLRSLEKVRETFSPDGLFPEAGARIALELRASIDPRLDPRSIHLEDTFTNEFVMRAAARLDRGAH